MWTKSHSMVTKEVTKEQIWKLFADVNNWHTWDDGIEFAKLEGKFEKGNYFILRPKGGPNVKVELLETIENKSFLDLTKFPLARMYDSHLFEDTGDGLKITNTITVKGILSFLWIKIVAQKIVDTLPEDMKKQIEAASKL
ncbi:SRPBCC family protein [Flavobacterium collinsii]|uniref:Polyketide cyclase n=1 Tax=Flavobacterium collinsii TaxID=1114861 RepID=A0A9W4X4Z4_9FLAO|nr:SRPBCC family protein [Flavobacterium collinsii]CAI2768683.1 Polyketide cyclase [Flavobacterium collinsii]